MNLFPQVSQVEGRQSGKKTRKELLGPCARAFIDNAFSAQLLVRGGILPSA